MLTAENELWLEIASKKLGVNLETLCNGILRQVRTEIGHPESDQALEEWIRRSIDIKSELESTLLQAKETLRATEETVKAAQLYLNQIQRSEFNDLG